MATDVARWHWWAIPASFERTGPHTLAAVVDAAEAEAPPRRLMLPGVAPLATATQNDVSFLNNRKYLPILAPRGPAR